MLAKSLLLTIILTIFTSLSSAWTIPLLGLGSADAPIALRTTEHSPQCKDINQGTYLCCSSAVNGGNPLVVALATAVAYQLPANTVNGLECSRDFTDCNANDATPLCCQVITLFPVAGLWCHYT